MALDFGSLVRSVASMLKPLAFAQDDEAAMQSLLQDLGVVVHDPQALASLFVEVGELRAQIEALADVESMSLQTVQAALPLCRQAFTLLRAADAASGPFKGVQGVGRDLLAWLVAQWLRGQHPVLRQWGVLLTLIDAAEQGHLTPVEVHGDVAIRGSRQLDRFALERLGALLRNPVALLQGAYLNALATDEDAFAVAERVFPPLQRLLRAYGVTCRYGINSLDAPALGEAAAFMSHSMVVYKDDPLAGDGTEAGLVLSFSPMARGDLGLVVSPFGTLQGQWQFGDWETETRLNAAFDVVAWGRHGATLLPAEGGDASQAPTLELRMSAKRSGSTWRFGDVDGTRLEVDNLALEAALGLGDAAQTLSLSAQASKAALVIAPGAADGFMASLVPPEGLRANFDLGLAWASGRGFSLSGSTGLDATFPMSLGVGGVRLSALHLRVAAADAGLATEVSATLDAAIGPVQATVQGLGLHAGLKTAPAEGNLGIADLSLGLKLPDGVGISLDTRGVLTGGGYLHHDAVTGTYGGAMQLSLRDQLTLSAYGLIATRLPGSGAGYSLLVFVTAEGFRPIPLGFGFMLQGLGGMLGVHRTFDVDVLRAGLRANTLPALLFPRDPVGNAPALMQALATAFPVQAGSYLLGLLARITWFTPTLVQMDLALILQLGARTRLLALGRVSALLPTRDDDLIRLNLDAMGVLDFDAGSFEADAVLVDSRLARRFPITGSAALRAAWPGGGAQHSSFVLAVGGLNPRYAPPAGFPALERVAIALTAGRNPRLVCDAYFALTANTVQFGARASLFAEALGFSIAGDLGFDALVTLLPPHFVVDFRAAVQLKRKSRNLFKVTLDGTLEGPLPLRLAARARFEILWMSFSVRFDFTLAEADRARQLPAAVDLAGELARALADPSNWRTRRAPALPHGVALRGLPANGALVLDPLGQLEVRQQVVPLNLKRDVDTWGGLPVAGERQFHLAATLNGRDATALPDAFAPARYFAMSDDEKLAAPSFEMMDAGLLLGDDALSFDAAAVVAAPLDYAPITLGALPAGGAPPSGFNATPLPSYAMPVAAMRAQRGSGPAALAPARRSGSARFRSPGAPPLVSLANTRWQVAAATGDTPASMAAMTAMAATPMAAVGTWAECQQALEVLSRGGGRWSMLPRHEHHA